ncbi:MAG: transglycosylase domain-containing protein [Fimbriimonas sp.]
MLLLSGGLIAFALKESNQADRMVDDLEDKFHLNGSLPTEIYSSDGQLLLRLSSEYRKPIEDLNDVPMFVRHAVLAAEDKRFYEHSGVDAVGLGRALFTALQDRKMSQGGSTLTMQLAKRLYSNSEKTFDRKLQDIAVAQAIERRKTKDQILLLYLNEVYFGEGAYGIAAAADVYFGKSLQQLSLGEAAILARCVRRPTMDSPMNNPDRAIRNREIVLRTMADEGWITESQYQTANSERLKLKSNAKLDHAGGILAPYFTNHVLAEIRTMYPEVDLNRAGMRIDTTLNFEIQKVAEREVARVVRENRKQRVTTAAFVLMNDEGRVLAEVGGVNFRRNQYNAISQGKRQPGSSFKPFVYAVGILKGIVDPNGTVSNDAIKLPDQSRPSGFWEPKNLGKVGVGGRLSVRSAFSRSINLPAIHTIIDVGPETVVQYARDSFGFRSELAPYAPLALGASAVSPLELAEGYSTFMLRGDRVRPTVIRKITGPDGKVLLDQEPLSFRGVFPSNVCLQMDDLLRTVVTSGTGTKAMVVPNARGKTGTTNDGRDAWFCGYSDGLVGVAWVANEQIRPGKATRYMPMPNVYGGSVTVQIWASVLKVAHEKFAKPLEPPTPEQMAGPDVAPIIEDPNEVGMDPQDEDMGTMPPFDPPAKMPTSPAQSPATANESPTEASSEKTVSLEICADTRQRSTPYCPETVTVSYRKGTEPKKKCPIHHGNP